MGGRQTQSGSQSIEEKIRREPYQEEGSKTPAEIKEVFDKGRGKNTFNRIYNL